MTERGTKRGRPRIPGLANFDEIRIPAQQGYHATCYKAPEFSITAMGITADEAREKISSLFQLNASSAEVVPIAVTFGQVTGWKCRPWGRLCYVLVRDNAGVLMHVDPVADGSIDEMLIESQLHTLTVE